MNSMFTVVYCHVNIAGICHCLDTNTINNKELKLILNPYLLDKKTILLFKIICMSLLK